MTVGDQLYQALAPVASGDAALGYPLGSYADALGSMFDAVDALASDAGGLPGWSALLDVERCPGEALPWLGQLVGVRAVPGEPFAVARQRVRDAAGLKRGTPASLIAAARATLTGAAAVFLEERLGGDAYALLIATRPSETPDPAATLAAILAVKPAGLVLTYLQREGLTYIEVADTGTYADVRAAYATYAALR